MMSHSHNLDHVVKLIGIQPTIRLVRLKGGRDISFSKTENLHDLHWMVVLIGLENAKKMCGEFNGITLKLPIETNALLQLRNLAIAEDFKAGKSISSLANTYGIDRKLVQTILDKMGLRKKDDVV